jgi:signal transduction histidine kinase
MDGVLDRGPGPASADALAGGEHARTNRLRKLANAALAINSTLSLDDTLKLITEQARDIVGAHQAATSMTVAEHWAHAITTSDLSEKCAAWHSQAPLYHGVGIYALVCRENRSIRLTQAEVEAQPTWPGIDAEDRWCPPTRGWLAAPLITRDGRNIGLIQLSDKLVGEFTEEDEAVLVQLAHMASVAIENARLYEAERDAHAEAEAAQRRLAFLAEASEILSASLEYETRLSSLVQLAVPYLADWCIIDMFQEDGAIHRLAIAHIDPSKEMLAHQLQERYPSIKPETPHTIMNVLQSGRPWLDSEVSDTRLAAEARDAKHLEMLRTLGFKSEMVVPLVARERALGTITFVMGESGRTYGPADLGLAEELARRAAMAVENARLYQDARMSAQAREELLSIVSHDLKNPLASIKGYAQLLRRRIERLGIPDAARLLDGLTKIDTASARMVAQIDELLDAARLRAGQPLDLDRERIDLAALVRQVAAEHQQTTQKHAIQVVSGVPELYGSYDAARIERVFANLLANAIKYSPQGGAIVIDIAHEQIDDKLWAVVAVRDQGVGIPAADLPHIFDRFHRAGNVARQIQGTGIGLSSARQIVEQHNGSIEVMSQEGVGATFTVRLPLEGDAGVQG